jgi:hypothetical protein
MFFSLQLCIHCIPYFCSRIYLLVERKNNVVVCILVIVSKKLGIVISSALVFPLLQGGGIQKTSHRSEVCQRSAAGAVIVHNYVENSYTDGWNSFPCASSSSLTMHFMSSLIVDFSVVHL